MTPEFYEQVCQICYEALQLEASRRAEFLDQACGGQAGLRREVESMLSNERWEEEFLSAPALVVAADQVADRLELERTTMTENSKQLFDERPLSLELGAESFAPGVKLGGRYVIEKELSQQGGICAVFLARDQKLQQAPVVIKVLLMIWQRSRHKTWLEKKFKGEITALARIDHPGVVRALDVGELPDGRSYLVMQYVPGVSLRESMTPVGMELGRVANLIHQIGQAVTAAHQQGVIHRDLKPENIMLQSAGDEEYVKLIDFGIATVYEMADAADGQTTAIIGTRNYVAPEQLRGKPIAASDVYALGVIAYELVTGLRPFDPESIFQLYDMQRAGVKVKPRELRPDLPEAAEAAILRALSFAPQDRFSSAKEFADTLAQALTGEERRPAPFNPPVGRSRWPWVSVAALAVLIVVAVLSWRSLNSPSVDEHGRAEQRMPVRSLRYTMEVLRDPERYPRNKPFNAFDNAILGPGDRIRFYLNSPEPGSFYVINEGPAQTDGLPEFIFLFPDTQTNGGSAQIQAGQPMRIPLPGDDPDNWFQLDQEEGVEKIWLVWSQREVPELERVKSWANPKDQGVIKDSGQRRSVANYLTKPSASNVEVERDERSKETRLKGEGETLIWSLKLVHQ